MIYTSGIRIVSRWILFSLLMFVSLSATYNDSVVLPPGKESSWELIENSEGVKIYLRWVELSDKIKIRERKAEIMVHTTLDKTIKAITDAAEIPNWMSGVKKVMLLHRESPSKWFAYTLYGLPWPFNDREMITMCTLSYSSGKDKAYLNMRSSDEGYPPARGVERLTHYKASWELFEVKSGLIRMTFIARSDDPPAFPRCIQDPVIKKVFHKNMVNLKEMLDGNRSRH